MADEKQACVLIVDDNRINRVVLENHLSREGYRTLVASGGKEALQILGFGRTNGSRPETEAVDVVVLDIMMPEVDGLEVLRRIRERQSPNEMPVIMATAKDQTADIVDTLAMGANDYVIKPIDMPVLLARLRTQVSLKMTHAALKEAQSSLIEAAKMESVGYLAAGVAHEVRNPLAQIQMGIDAIEGNPAVQADANLLKIVELVGNGVEKADAIVRELMKVSMSGQLDLQLGSVNELVQDVLNSLELTSKKAGVEAETNLEEALPSAPLAVIEMRQALAHVFRNAIEAMPRGGVLSVRTAIAVVDDSPIGRSSRSGNRLRSGDEAVVIEIADTGSGIPEENLQQVFDPFFTTKAAGEGTGLGLSVAKKVIDLHCGSISLRNRRNGPGARVVLQLPSNGSLRTSV